MLEELGVLGGEGQREIIRTTVIAYSIRYIYIFKKDKTRQSAVVEA